MCTFPAGWLMLEVVRDWPRLKSAGWDLRPEEGKIMPRGNVSSGGGSSSAGS
jgi:hypothetical protein